MGECRQSEDHPGEEPSSGMSRRRRDGGHSGEKDDREGVESHCEPMDAVEDRQKPDGVDRTSRKSDAKSSQAKCDGGDENRGDAIEDRLQTLRPPGEGCGFFGIPRGAEEAGRPGE